MKKFDKKYRDIITTESLYRAWEKFLCGKRKRSDVLLFQSRLADNIFKLQKDLRNKTYCHGGYEEFKIADPKPRIIHKASVRDRLLHHLIHHELYPYFDKKFIFHSYSCRNNKGTHKAIYYFKSMTDTIKSKTLWVLKCDIRKFFASIDHKILKRILEKYIKDEYLLKILGNIDEKFVQRSLVLWEYV